MRVAIENGHLIDPASQLDEAGSVYIANGIIVGVGQAPDGFEPDERIDARGQVICPGLVELTARLREPGHEHKGTIASETCAAARGGITTLCVPPDTQPVIDTAAVIELIHRRANEAAFARVYTLGALTPGLLGEHLSEMGHLRAAGAIGVTNLSYPMANTQVMRRAMEYAASNDLTVFLYPEDPGLANHGCAHEGTVSTRLGLPGIPAAAETQAVANYLMLIEQTGVRAHFCHLSTAKAVNMIGRAQYEGYGITSNVTAHHLHLTEMDLGFFDANCHVRPPLRTQRDRDALRDAIAEGKIEALSSDHQPHDADAKLAPFGETEPGISALETLLPLGLRLVQDGLLSLPQLIERLTLAPADILGLNVGRLQIGAPGDICIFDPQHEWMLGEQDLHSHGRNTPFIGWHFVGRVTRTLLGGRTVFALESQ